jgi:hypothetical protein
LVASIAPEAFRMPKCIQAIQISSITNLSAATSTDPTGNPPKKKIKRRKNMHSFVVALA